MFSDAAVDTAFELLRSNYDTPLGTIYKEPAMESFIFNGPANSRRTVALAHGAGAAMDSPFMNAMAEGLATRELRVARFEFPYMAARRVDPRAL